MFYRRCSRRRSARRSRLPVRRVLEIARSMRRMQQQEPGQANELSVGLELQADCLAGVWGHSTQERKIIDQHDVEDGLRAAAAVGDDRLQRMAGRRVAPESFTHGSSAQRVAGTALGAATGALAGTWFPANALVFGICILVLGIIFVPFRLERNSYRYAGITLAIVMLVPGHSGRIIALHRFFEVSVGIAVGLALSALWPER